MAIQPSLALTAAADFMEPALAELRKAAPGATLLAMPAADIALCTLPGSIFTLAERWRGQPPIFVRHIHPVQLTTPLRGGTADPHIIQQEVVAEFAELVDPELFFSVQTRVVGKRPYKPFTINRAVSDQLQALTGAPLNVRAPQQIISILATGESAFSGLSLAPHNLSDWAGGEHRFARHDAQISRAEFKLLEAFGCFNLQLPARGRALDLGAAPGGWTRILREKEQYVTAVDPGALHPRLAADKSVRHLPITAEAYLAEGPDKYDLIVNDMRLDARDSARIMNSYARHLYTHGMAIMTLKLPGEQAIQTMQQAAAILQKKYYIRQARQLFHNRQEITLVLEPIHTGR